MTTKAPRDITRNGTVLLGMVAVDSGQLLMTDPCYLQDFASDGFAGAAQPTSSGLYPYSYSGACSATLSGKRGGPLAFAAGHEGAGVAFSTAYGDGMYPVYGEYADGVLMSVKVVFANIDEDDEDDEFEDDED